MTRSGERPPRRRPFAFLALTAGLTVPFWALAAVLETPEDSPVQLPASALALVCPIAAAAILSARDEGARGVGRLLHRSVSLRGVRARWLAPAVLLPPVAYVAGFALLVASGSDRTSPTVGPADLVVLLAIFLVAGVAEEAGWTGYAVDPLRERRSALAAAVIIGAVWGLVHVVPDLQGGHDAAWIFWQRVVGSIALRVLIVWLYANTGSVGVAVLFHAIENVCWQVLASTGPYEPAAVAPMFAIAAALVTWRWGPQTLARFRAAGRPTPSPAT